MQSDVNPLHFLLDIPPQVSALEVIPQIKQISTFRIYKKHRPFLKKHFWNENTFWSDGSFVCSTGDASTETIKRSIAEQGYRRTSLPSPSLKASGFYAQLDKTFTKILFFN